MTWSRIAGTGSFLPPTVVKNDELARRLSGLIGFLLKEVITRLLKERNIRISGN